MYARIAAASAPTTLSVAEVPYTFRARLHGESKLDAMVLWEYLLLLLDKLVGRWVPPRLIMFGAIGGLGLVLHLALLGLLLGRAGLPFQTAKAWAVWKGRPWRCC